MRIREFLQLLKVCKAIPSIIKEKYTFFFCNFMFINQIKKMNLWEKVTKKREEERSLWVHPES